MIYIYIYIKVLFSNILWKQLVLMLVLYLNLCICMYFV